MPDYAANSHKDREGGAKPPKEIHQVTTSKVIIQKKGIGRKFKDLFVEADFRSVTQFVISDVLLPAFRNMIVDSTSKGIERIMYGERGSRRPGSGPRVTTYQTPVQRSVNPMLVRGYASDPRNSRYIRDDIVLTSKDEADLAIEQMAEILDTYEQVSVGDLNEMVGIPTSHIDQKWGWTDLTRARVIAVREGWLLDLPQAEPIA